MVKLMAKKAKALPSAHSLEEWHTQALQRHHHQLSGLTPHHAALRIQLRYRVYKDKVRALLKKSAHATKDEATEHSVETTAASVKARGGVKVSSVALAVAFKARKDADADATPLPLMQQRGNNKMGMSSGSGSVRSDAAANATPWHVDGWTVPTPQTFLKATTQHDDFTMEDDDDVGSENHHSAPSAAVTTRTETSPTVGDVAEPSSGRPHAFVDAMHHSWLLASMEERCAHAAAVLGARGSVGAHRELTVLDIRHTVLDLLFIFRSGRTHNFHGRAPSSVTDHHKNLVARLTNKHSEVDEARVRRIFDALKSDMFFPAVRALGWMLTKTWRMLFHGLHIDVESLQRVREILEAAHAQNVSVVFTPTHKTHLDYLIVSYVCFAYGIPLPRIAAGNNLDLPVIGSFLRANGSFFIRRSFRNDPLYKQVLQHYVHELLDDGNPIEVFIEGGRSRHGRVCKPKMGFLSMFQEYVHEDTTRDVLLVPIALDYDKVFEVEEYANQLLGKPKQRESLSVFFQSLWDLLFINCGHCYVRFGEPLSLRAQPSLQDTAQTISTRLQRCGTITSTAIVSAILMWTRTYTTREMLMTRTQWLIDELERRGATVAHLRSSTALVDHALAVLHVTVTPNGVVQSKLSYPTRALELGFYRNHLLHVFLPDMAILGAMDALVHTTNPAATTCILGRTNVLSTARMIWSFLRHICRHNDLELAQQLEEVVLRVPHLSLSGEDHVVVQDVTQWRVARNVAFTLSLHWAFIDSLWISLVAAWAVRSSSRVERDLVRLAQLVAKELFVSRQVVHAEAFCSESIKQALEFLQERDVLRATTCETSGARMYALAGSQAETELEELMTLVNTLRKPESFLYRDTQVRTGLTRSEAEALVDRVESDAEAAKGKDRRAGVYATWMSH